MIITKDSHLDHGLTAEQVEVIRKMFADREGFFIETFMLEGANLPCGLHGPLVGDDPIRDFECVYKTRGTRLTLSRLVDRPQRPTDTVTVIASPPRGTDDPIHRLRWAVRASGTGRSELLGPGSVEEVLGRARSFTVAVRDGAEPRLFGGELDGGPSRAPHRGDCP